MNTLICPTVYELDREISERLNEITESKLWPPERVANYRGVLHSKSNEVITEDDTVDSAITKILDFKKRSDFFALLYQEKVKEALLYFSKDRGKGKTFIEALELAHAVYSSSILNNRVQYVSRMFSGVVTNILNALNKKNPENEYDRKQVCEGIKVGDKIIGGLSLIFNLIYGSVLKDLVYIKLKIKNLENTSKDANSVNNEELLDLKYKEKEHEKILENWAVIQTFARASLRTTEKLNLNNTVDIVENSEEYNENYNIEDYNPEEAVRESWHNQKDKQSAFGSLSAEVRRVLSMLPEYIDGERVRTDDLGLKVYLDPVEAHLKLTTILQGCFTKTRVLRKLKSVQNSHPWVTPIIEVLENDLEFATLFVINMHRGMQLYSGIRSKFKNGVRQFTTKTLNRLENSTYSNYLAKVLLDKEDSLDVFKTKDSRSKIIDLINSYGRTKQEVADKVVLITSYYKAFGFDVKFEDSYEIAAGRLWTSFWNLITNNFRQAHSDYDSFGLKKSYYEKLTAKKTRGTNQLSEFLQKLTQILDNGKLSAYERRITFKDSKGKTASYDSIVESSYMTDIFDNIRYFVENKDPEGLKLWIKNKFLICKTFYVGNLETINTEDILNPWLKEMYLDADAKFAEDGFCSTFIFDRFLGDIGSNIEFEQFTPKQHIVATIQQYKKDKDLNNKSQYGHYPTFILGDSGITKFIASKRYDVNAVNEEGKKPGKEKLLEYFYNIYLSEQKRKEVFKSMLKKCKDDKINTKFSFMSDKYKFEFKFLRFLNEDIDNNTLLSKEEFYSKLDTYMESSIEEFKKRLEEYECLNSTTINETEYYNDLGIKKGEFNDFITDFFWNQKINMISQLLFFTVDLAFYSDTKDLQKRYKEIHASGIPLNLDILKEGENAWETCIYFEDLSVGREGYTDIDNALAYNFGLENLGEESADSTEELIIQKGKETLKYSKYSNNTLTDGLGFRSLDSYRKVSRMAGTWTKLHEKAYNKIKDLLKKGNITKEDIAKIASLAVIFQPIKPFTYTHEIFEVNENDKQLIPVQHKYSEIVLIPELLPEGMLKDMATFMLENKIDVLASTKAVKVGCFGQTDIQYETDENFEHTKDAYGNKQEIKTKEALYNALRKGTIHKIPYADYRIQTNVPLHLNEDGLFGTQIRKLVMSQLNLDKIYDYFLGKKIKLYENSDGVNTTGRNILALYNALIISNILESFNSFSETIKDGKKLSEIFILNVISNGREALDNIFAYSITGDDNFVIPLFEGCLDHDSSAALFSMFKKAVNKQKIKGGSAVLASALGIEGYQKDGGLRYITDPNDPHNILYAECEIPFELSYTDVNGKEIHLNFEDYCNSDGTLILDETNELDITKPENKLYQSYYTIDDAGNKHYYKPKIEVEYPGILSVVAYRIPTERAYSMINIRVKRFSPLISGGTIKVPAQGTTIAGFDFDIDKLYLMFKLFEELYPFYEYLLKIEEGDSKEDKNKKRASIKEIYKKIYELHPDLIDYSHETKIDFSENIGDIFLQFYEDNPTIYSDLKSLRDKNDKNKKLVDYFDSSLAVKKFAKDKNMTVPELKEWITQTYGIWYYYGKEVIIDGSLRYKFKENVSKEDKTKTFEEAAKLLNIKTKENIKGRFVEYDFEKVPSKQKRVARNNMLIELMQHRLMDKETFIERYSPGGFPQASDAAKLIRYLDFSDENYSKMTLEEIKEKAKSKNFEPDYDATDPMTVIIYNLQNQIAGKLIGIFANQNANHAISLFLHEFSLKSPICFCGKDFRDFIHPPVGRDVNGTMAELLAASVDAVKDPTLSYLNLNTLTAAPGAMLARLGYTMDEIALLFNLPIIKEICDHAFNNQISIDKALLEVKTIWINANKEEPLKGFSKEEVNIEYLEEGTLIKNIYLKRNKSTNKYYKDSLVEVLKLFNVILAVSKDLSNYVSTTKYTASNSVGSTFGDFYALQQKVIEFTRKYEDDTLSFNIKVDNSGRKCNIDNSTDLLNMGTQEYIEKMMVHPFGYEQCMYDMNRKSLNLFSKYFPYENTLYVNLRDNMRKFSRNDSLLAKTINLIHSDFLVYLMCKTKSLFNPESKIYPDGEETTTKKYYEEVFPKKLAEFIKNNEKYYDILSEDHLYFSVSEDGKVDINIRNIGKLNALQRDLLTRSWEDLYKDNKDLARDLFMYNFYKTGFNYSPNSFIHLAPIALKKSIIIENTNNVDITYSEYLNQILKGANFNVTFADFAKLYILNHTESYEFIETLSSKTALYLEIDPYNIPLNIVINNIRDSQLSRIITKETKDSTFVIPCIKYIDNDNKSHFYIIKNSDNGLMNNEVVDGPIVYEKVEVLGYTNIKTSYYPESTSDMTSVMSDGDEQIGTPSEEQYEGNTNNNLTMSQVLDIMTDIAYIVATKYGYTDTDKLSTVLYNKSIPNIVNIKNKLQEGEEVFCLDENGNPSFIC